MLNTLWEATALWEVLFQPLMDLGIDEVDPSVNAWFILPGLRAFGHRRVNEYLLDVLATGDNGRKSGAVNALYWAEVPLIHVRALNPRRSGNASVEPPHDSVALSDIWERKRKALLTTFMSNENVHVRRTIIGKLNLNPTDYPEHLRALVPRVLEIARASEDEHIRHRVEVQLGAVIPLMALPHRSGVNESATREAEAHGDSDALDTHPWLHERLTALGDTTVGAPPTGPSAMSLIGNVPKATRALLAHVWGKDAVGKLRPIGWDAVGEAVYGARWKALATQHVSWLSRFTAERIPFDKRDLIGLGSELVKRTEININSEERIGRAAHVLSAGLATVLLSVGFRVETGPGRGIELVRPLESVDPFGIVTRLMSGAMTADEWRTTCERVGIAGVPPGHSEATPAA